MSHLSAILPIIRSQMSSIRMPTPHSHVYKDECVYSFDTPYFETGLYLNLLTMHGVGDRFLALDSQRTGCKLYLFQKWRKVKKQDTKDEGELQPSKLAIGVEGGFGLDPTTETIKEHALCVFNGSDKAFVPLPCMDLPEYLSNILQACIDHEGMIVAMQASSSWSADDVKIVSKYADGLEQINAHHKKISSDPSTWVDEATGEAGNLWLNLSTGYIGGGRKNWDGSGGSGSALQHFIDTGKKYPLVVKLGTITPHGAEVWSYADDEDCLVIDPKLSEHLAFWGIDIMQMSKTEKTLQEMEVSLNLSYDWSRILGANGEAAGKKVTGAGYLGFQNLGNSCYMNSALVALLNIEEFRSRYLNSRPALLEGLRGASADPLNDLPIQLSKLAEGVLMPIYVTNPDLPEGKKGDNEEEDLNAYPLAPRMFKQLMGKGGGEWATGRQQDVSEYLNFLLERIAAAEKEKGFSPLTPSLFDFHVEAKLRSGGEVFMLNRGDRTLYTSLDLPVPLQAAVKEGDEGKDSEEGGEMKRARVEGEAKQGEGREGSSAAKGGEGEGLTVPFDACLQAYLSPEHLNMRHPRTNVPGDFVKTTRMATFPPYLWVRVGRYYVGENWVPRKITATVPMPAHLDLTPYRGRGLEEGEVMLDEVSAASNASNAAASAAPVDAPDLTNLINELTNMGFEYYACARAASQHPHSLEDALSWLLEHMGDAGVNDPFDISAAGADAHAAMDVSPDADFGKGEGVSTLGVGLLMSMGYTEDQCKAALISNVNDIERAADWLLSHSDQLDLLVPEILASESKGASTASPAANPVLDSPNGQYSLVAIISHIGKSLDHGHYVCHVYKDNQWVLFNDDKVCVVEKAPLGHGFLYLYRRDDHVPSL
eukprot:gene30921-37371_t